VLRLGHCWTGLAFIFLEGTSMHPLLPLPLYINY
jgi:hypothetical protein